MIGPSRGTHGRQNADRRSHITGFDAIQVNALLLLLERQTPDASIKEDFEQLISEGMQTVIAHKLAPCPSAAFQLGLSQEFCNEDCER
jgi:hypothetical protein